jgi:hypothetical protein
VLTKVTRRDFLTLSAGAAAFCSLKRSLPLSLVEQGVTQFLLPRTCSVEMALNSRVSSTIIGGGRHFGRSVTGAPLSRVALRDLMWAASRVYDFRPEIPLRNYALTPSGLFYYDAAKDELITAGKRLRRVYIPPENEGGAIILQTLEGFIPSRIGEPPHFGAVWKLGSSYQALSLLSAGYKPKPIACCNWAGSKFRGGVKRPVVDNNREVALEYLRVAVADPSWDGGYYAPGLHSDWVTDRYYGDPKTDSDVSLSSAIDKFRFSPRISAISLSRRHLNQLLYGTCGSTCHDLPRARARNIGTCYPSSMGSYHIRTDDARSLAYVVNEKGLWKYISLTEEKEPTSSFELLLENKDLKEKIELAAGITPGFSPQYVVLNSANEGWLSGKWGGWVEIAEGGSAEYSLRMQAYSLNLALSTFLLATSELRIKVRETCPVFLAPLAVIAVGYKERY